MALTLLMLAVLANSLGEQRSPLAAAPPSPRIFMPLAKDLSVTPAEWSAAVHRCQRSARIPPFEPGDVAKNREPASLSARGRHHRVGLSSGVAGCIRAGSARAFERPQGSSIRHPERCVSGKRHQTFGVCVVLALWLASPDDCEIQERSGGGRRSEVWRDPLRSGRTSVATRA